MARDATFAPHWAPPLTRPPPSLMCKVTPTPRWLTQADMKLANQRPFSPEPFLCPWELEDEGNEGEFGHRSRRRS